MNYPTFEEWLNKYFEGPKLMKIWKVKKGMKGGWNRKLFDEGFLRRKYNQAYNIKSESKNQLNN